MTAATLEKANEALRAAVTERLAATPSDDPKMTGYSCCEGHRFRGDSLRSDNYAEWEPPTGPPTTAERTLHNALAAVRDRHGKYGPPAEHFSRTASLVNAAFGTSFTAADWALVMVLDKVARQLGTGTTTEDAAIDIAGYAACHEECRCA
jgi:hypothetical protein